MAAGRWTLEKCCAASAIIALHVPVAHAQPAPSEQTAPPPPAEAPVSSPKTAEPIEVTVEGDKAPALKVGDVIVRVDPRYFRPAEVETLLGDPSKAKQKLGWVPEITVQEMCAEMVREDLKVAQRHALLKQHGHDVPVAVEN